MTGCNIWLKKCRAQSSKDGRFSEALGQWPNSSLPKSSLSLYVVFHPTGRKWMLSPQTSVTINSPLPNVGGLSFSLGLCMSKHPFPLPGRVVIVILQDTLEGKWAPVRLSPLLISRKQSFSSWGQLSEPLCTFFSLDLQVKGKSVLRGRLMDSGDDCHCLVLLSLWFNQSPSWYGIGRVPYKEHLGRTPSLQKKTTRNRTVLKVFFGAC